MSLSPSTSHPSFRDLCHELAALTEHLERAHEQEVADARGKAPPVPTGVPPSLSKEDAFAEEEACENESPKQPSVAQINSADSRYSLQVDSFDHPHAVSSGDNDEQHSQPSCLLKNHSNLSVQTQVKIVTCTSDMLTNIRQKKSSKRIALATKVAEAADDLGNQIENAKVSVKAFALLGHWNLDDEALLKIKGKCDILQRMNTHSMQRLTHSLRRDDSQIDDFGSPGMCIHPQCKIRLIWDFLSLIFMLYDLIFIPMAVLELPRNSFFLTFDFGGAAFWTLDMGASFCTGTYIEGHLVRDPWRVANKYARTWLPFDSVMVLTDWISLLLGEIWSSTLTMSRSIHSGRVLRYLRLARFFRLFRIFRAHRTMLGFAMRIKKPTLLLTFSIFKLMLIALFLTHLLSCVWYAVGIESSDGWVRLSGTQDKPLFEKYLDCFQHAISRLHPSRMAVNMELNTTTERLLAIFATGASVVGTSLFVSSVTSTMGEFKRLKYKRARCSLILNEYINQHHISVAVSRRARKFCDSECIHHLDNKLDSELFEYLPEDLMAQMRVEAWAPALIRHPLFLMIHSKHARVENQICYRALSEVHVWASSKIFTTGDCCSRMLFTISGESFYKLGKKATKDDEIDVMRHASLSSTLLAGRKKVDAGTWLCEPALFILWQYCGDLKALTDSVLISLEADEVAAVAKKHEQAYFDLVIYAKCFLAEINSNVDQISDLAHSMDLTITNDNSGLCALEFDVEHEEAEVSQGAQRSRGEYNPICA